MSILLLDITINSIQRTLQQWNKKQNDESLHGPQKIDCVMNDHVSFLDDGATTTL